MRTQAAAVCMGASPKMLTLSTPHVMLTVSVDSANIFATVASPEVLGARSRGTPT
jgi:hypothetical protein